MGAQNADGNSGGISAGLAGSSKASSGVSGVSRLSAAISGVSQVSGISAGLGAVTIQQPIAAAGPRKRKNEGHRAVANSTVYPDLVAGPLSSQGQNIRKINMA